MECLIFIIIIFLPTTLQSSTELREYCNDEDFQASCAEDDEVLVVRSAWYGRMRRGRCLKGEYEGSIGCKNNVLIQVDRICSGRKSCNLRVGFNTFNIVGDSCHGNSRVFLEVIYDCLKVMTSAAGDCTRNRNVLIKGIQHGYIASSLTQRYHYGTSSCPWRIELSRWQRINLTLIDFSVPLNGSYQDKNFCHRYAQITERTTTMRSNKICGDDKRERGVFASRTNVVEIRIISREDHDYKGYHFLIRFDALGCPDPHPPKNGWFLRESDGVTMYCNHSSIQWKMVCDEFTNRWIGHLENCSSVQQEGTIVVWGRVSIPQTVSILLTATLCFIGLIIIVLFSLLCLEWFKGNRQKLLRESIQIPQDQIHPKPDSCPHHSQQQQDINDNSKLTSQQLHHQQLHHQQLHHQQQQASVSIINTQRSSTKEEFKPPGILRNSQNYQQHRLSNFSPQEPLVFNTMSDKADNEKFKMSRSSNSIVSNDYAREMWPMVPPPKLSGVEECVRPDSRADGARSSLFQYGDSVTLMTSAGQSSSGVHLCRTLQPRGTALVELEDDTHIYETPKYLRREKAATMRLQSKPSSSKGQGHYCPSTTLGSRTVEHSSQHQTSKTLPRNTATASTGAKP